MTDKMRAILAMVAAMFVFNIGDTLIKVAGVGLPTGEMMFVRGLFSCSMILGYAWWIGALSAWRASEGCTHSPKQRRKARSLACSQRPQSICGARRGSTT